MMRFRLTEVLLVLSMCAVACYCAVAVGLPEKHKLKEQLQLIDIQDGVANFDNRRGPSPDGLQLLRGAPHEASSRKLLRKVFGPNGVTTGTPLFQLQLAGESEGSLARKHTHE